jgi:TadE-like protein
MLKIKTERSRRGASAVEFAIVAPVFLILLFGIIEFGRVMMVQQILVNASRAGAREASLPDSSVNSVRSIVTKSLQQASIVIAENQIGVSPDPALAFDNEEIRVTVEVPYADIGWIPGVHLKGVQLRASTSMRAEQFK